MIDDDGNTIEAPDTELFFILLWAIIILCLIFTKKS